MTETQKTMNYATQEAVPYLKTLEIHPIKNQQLGYRQTLEILQGIDGVAILYSDDEKERIVAQIRDYIPSLKCGSKNWCISSVIYGGSLGNANGIMYWNMYKGHHPEREQYFVWDFKQDSEDWVLVGTTTDEDKGQFYCAYNYPNNPFDMEEYIRKNNWDRNLFFNKQDTFKK